MDILNTLPHRYPMLLVDKVLEQQEDAIIAQKNVSFNEAYFQGHFPGKPVMPGVLIIEAHAQAGALILLDKFPGKIPYLVGCDKVRFKKPILPGDILEMHVTLLKMKGFIGIAKATGHVDGKEVFHGEIKFALGD